MAIARACSKDPPALAAEKELSGGRLPLIMTDRWESRPPRRHPWIR